MMLMLIPVLILNNLKRLAFVNKEKYKEVRKRILFIRSRYFYSNAAKSK